MAPQVSGIDSNVQDSPPSSGHRGGLWILTVALVAFAGIAAAVAIEALDGSSSNDAKVTTVYVDPRLDADFHRTPGQLSPKDPVPAEWDNDFHRVPGQASPKDPVAQAMDKDFQREANQAASQEEVSAETDKDFQREANQAASQEEVEPYGSGLPHEAH
jgi:hypothetical protein